MEDLEKKKEEPGNPFAKSCALSINILMTISAVLMAMGLPDKRDPWPLGFVLMISGGAGYLTIFMIMIIECFINERKKRKEQNDENNNEIKEVNINVYAYQEKDISPETELKRTLYRIGNNCTCIQRQTDQAIRHLGTVENFSDAIEESKQYAHNKAPLILLETELGNFKEGIMQNCRDIIAICVIGRAEKGGILTEEEILSIEDEVRSSDEKIKKFQELMRTAGKAATQLPETDVFANIGIDASITAAENYLTKTPQ